MEFNFQGWDAQMQQYMSHTPLKEGLRSGTSLGGSQGGLGILPRPLAVDTRDAIQRELEKERIREEIVAEEIERRRVLEAEVRREMAMEMALHGGGGFPSSFTPTPSLSHTNRLDPVMPPLAPVSFEEKFGGSGRQRCEIGGFPHQRLPGDGKKKVVDLGKANGVTPSGAKGKPAGASSSEWSCPICKVSAPCENGFKEHLVGKKHQAQMAALKAKNTKKHGTQQKKCKKQSGEIGLGVAPKKPTTMEMDSSKVLKSKKPVKTQPPPPLMKKNSSKCDSNKEEGKKKLWFSCEICNVRASSDKDMNTHIKGKKHLENLLKLHQESSESGLQAADPGTKKPCNAKEKHKAETEVADRESIGSVVVNVTYT